MSSLLGQSLGRYHILEPLGEGGMATVYKAYDTRLERDVAVKVIRVDQFAPAALQRVLQRFEREAKSLAKLSHPNIVGVIDYGEHEGVPYLVMEYLPGGTLKQRLGKPLPWQEAVKVLLPVVEALDYAHSQGIIHRDVKPSNILLTQRGQPMLTDFGIAKLLDSGDLQTLTGTGIGVGTPEYMAPEQINAHSVDHRADIYSLGIVFYELVTGRKPFQADTPMAVMIMQARDPLPRPSELVPGLPERVEKVLLKALAKNPEDRYENMGGLARAMEGLERGTAPEPEKTPAKAVAAVRAAAKQETIDDMGVAAKTTSDIGLPTSRSTSVGIPQGRVPEKVEGRRVKSWLPWVVGILVTGFSLAAILAVYYSQRTGVQVLSTSTPMNVSNLTREGDGMVMVYVPEGSFEMGSESGDDNESPVHTVNLDAFWIDRTEVTNGMYTLCVEAGACDPPQGNGSSTRPNYYKSSFYGDFPVIFVDWNQAKAYCAWAKADLPTEAQWEKAARGTDGRTYPWGEGINCKKANYSGCIGDTKTAGIYPDGASMYGTLDMAGNVGEWVADWYDANYYNDSQSSNPQGPSNGDFRVLRGGSWYHDENFLRTSARLSGVPDNIYYSVGFRCARGTSP